MAPCRAPIQDDQADPTKALRVVRELAKVVQQHVTTKDKDNDNEDRALEKLQKVKSPVLRVFPDPLVAKAWLIQMEKIYKVIGCTEEKKVTSAVFMLQGEVKHWWRAIEGTLPLEEDKPLTQGVFLIAFRDFYFPQSIRDEKEVEFMELIQGRKIVMQYNAKFMELVRFTPHIARNELTKTKIFQTGLRHSI